MAYSLEKRLGGKSIAFDGKAFFEREFCIFAHFDFDTRRIRPCAYNALLAYLIEDDHIF